MSRLEVALLVWALAALPLGLMAGLHLQAIRRTLAKPPECFNHKPANPGHQAEHDCPNCPLEGQCRHE